MPNARFLFDSCSLNPPRGLLRGGFSAGMKVYFSVRSRTPPQTARNALAIAVQKERMDPVVRWSPDTGKKMSAMARLRLATPSYPGSRKSLLNSPVDDFILYIRAQFDEIGGIAGHPNQQIPVVIRILLGLDQCVLVDYV